MRRLMWVFVGRTCQKVCFLTLRHKLPIKIFIGRITGNVFHGGQTCTKTCISAQSDQRLRSLLIESLDNIKLITTEGKYLNKHNGMTEQNGKLRISRMLTWRRYIPVGTWRLYNVASLYDVYTTSPHCRSNGMTFIYNIFSSDLLRFISELFHFERFDVIIARQRSWRSW